MSLVNIGVLAESTESKVYLAGLLTEALNWGFFGDVADPVLPAAPGVEHHPAVLPRPAVLLPSQRPSQVNLLSTACNNQCQNKLFLMRLPVEIRPDSLLLRV